MNRDWSGNSTSIYANHGASNHSVSDRETHDFYATPPEAVEMLCNLEQFNLNILEPCCGTGHISKVLQSRGYNVESRDLVDRGFGIGGCDFLSVDNLEWCGDIITNPPYKYAQEFVEKALDIVPEGNRVAMFLKLTFLEGKSRKNLFKIYPPQFIYVSSSRLNCGMNGVFTGTSAVAYAWFIWQKGFRGDPTIKWFN